MNNKYIFFLFVLCVNFSCTKIISIDLNNATSKYVVQGELSNLSSAYTFVKLGKTIPFSDPNTFPPVSNAVVTIADDQGNTMTLTENRDTLGLYQNPTCIGIPGRIYTLTINVNNETLRATSKMLDPVAIKNVAFFASPFRDKKEDKDTTYVTGPNINTTSTTQSLFLLKQKINGIYDSSVYVRRSLPQITNASMQPLFGRQKIYAQDSVEVFLMCLDQELYDYFYVLVGGGQRNNQVTPSNSPTNIQGNAIGYFGAFATAVKKLKVRN